MHFSQTDQYLCLTSLYEVCSSLIMCFSQVFFTDIVLQYIQVELYLSIMFDNVLQYTTKGNQSTCATMPFMCYHHHTLPFGICHQSWFRLVNR